MLIVQGQLRGCALGKSAPRSNASAVRRFSASALPKPERPRWPPSSKDLDWLWATGRLESGSSTNGRGGILPRSSRSRIPDGCICWAVIARSRMRWSRLHPPSDDKLGTSSSVGAGGRSKAAASAGDLSTGPEMMITQGVPHILSCSARRVYHTKPGVRGSRDIDHSTTLLQSRPGKLITIPASWSAALRIGIRHDR